jgi:hypothetical protein
MPGRFHRGLVLIALPLVSASARAQLVGDTLPRPFVSCPDLPARGDCPLADVSLVQLISTPERFDGRHVRVIGFVHLEFEGNAAYLHREDFDSGLLKNAVWVDFRRGTLSSSHPINDRYVLLEGVFDARHFGHLGLFAGTLSDITRAEPWPSRAEIARTKQKFTALQRAAPPPGAIAAHLAGCYRLTLGPWSKRTSLGPPSPTEVFRLDSTLVNNGIPGAHAAARVAPDDRLPPTDPRARWLQPPWWRTIGADSIQVFPWSTGTESEAFYGHVTGDEHRGVLRNTSDAIPMDPKTRGVLWDAWPWATATARRVSCP